jgi:hypothetical protein
MAIQGNHGALVGSFRAPSPVAYIWDFETASIMNPDLKGVWEHIRDLGLGALAHANRNAAYLPENKRAPELSVLQAAHAAELLIKARIAQEHPLLIFEHLPRPSRTAPVTLLNLEDLFTQGRTFQWTDLPDRLWAVTGYTLPARDKFEAFGKLRNSIQHFAAPNLQDAGGTTLRFVFSVIDPFIHDCWGGFAVDFDEDLEPYVYFVGALVHREILFLVSPDAAAEFERWDVDWSKVSEKYKTEMHQRVQQAKSSQ